MQSMKIGKHVSLCGVWFCFDKELFTLNPNLHLVCDQLDSQGYSSLL